MTDSADPLAGSYAIEELTTEIENRATAYLDRIDVLGGMLRAIESGYVQREIQESAYKYQQAIESGTAVVVGVNRFREAQSTVQTLRIDPVIEKQQIERVQAVRARRDASLAETALKELEEAASTTANMLPRILNCVEAYVTVGEISNRLRSVWGEYRESSTI